MSGLLWRWRKKLHILDAFIPAESIFLFVHLWVLWCLWLQIWGEKRHFCACLWMLFNSTIYLGESLLLLWFLWMLLSFLSSFFYYFSIFIFNLKIYFQGLLAAHLLKAPSPFCYSGNMLINGLIHNLQLDLPRDICGLWVKVSVPTSAKWTSIIFSPQLQKWLPWQRHFALPP